jgi:hypothetical protein
MTNEEIHNIEVGDKLYVDHKIHKRIFNGDWFIVYKPDKFYTVFEIDKTKDYIKLTTASELSLNKLVVYKSSNVKIPISIPILYMQHFKLLKKKDYEFINIDYFAQI